jgi:excinuclease ABC subunit A
MGEISPRSFSFNSPYGACSSCSGLGTKIEIEPDLVVPDKSLSVNEGALLPWSSPITTRRHRWKWAARSYYYEMLEDVSDYYGFSLDTPFKKLPEKYQNILLYSSPDEIYESGELFEGVITQIERRYHRTESDFVREEIFNKYMNTRVCPDCQGKRLKKESLAVAIQEKSIADIAAFSIKEAQGFFNKISLSPTEALIGREVLKEIKKRLSFLINVGLDYITIDRPAATLAGGEAERIHLATQIGSSLVGVIYILDEPTIGLHPRDVSRLISTLEDLRDLANTVLVVEHDPATIHAADHIIDLGPGAGEKGGRVVVSGSLSKIIANPESLTGAYISGKLKVPLPAKRRSVDFKRVLEIKGAAQFNLKNINVKIPLGAFVCITGVSGSGKSTLVQEILYKALAQKIYHSKEKPGKHKELLGIGNIDKVINIDQSPIGRTPRSNPATYTDLFTPIRQLFSQLPEAKIRGYKPGRFSFNVKGGRCEACSGEGLIKIEMQFLPDVYVPCEVCKEKRFNQETLQVKYKGKNIADILSMSVEEALKFFKNIPRIKDKLQTLSDVGLDYIKIGQSATTLSGGEAQRVKLSKELSKRSTGRTLYLLDEPTTGLHFADIEKLLSVLHRLVDKGNTALVIEHNLDVVKTADYIIDLGPEGGEQGGEVVATGSPEELCQSKKSYTGRYLKKFLL